MARKVKERHPFRFLFKLLLAVGLVTAVARLVAPRAKELAGLTESEARAQFESKLAPRIGDEKAAEIADRLIPRLKERGVIKPDPVEEAIDEAKETATDAAEGVKEAVDDSSEAVREAIDNIEEKTD